MLKVADVWEEQFDDLPPRSRLISLKPKGHGSIWQESLTSLFIRIARAHTCAPLVLLNKEVLPNTEVRHTKSSGSFVAVHLKTMNGVGKYAAEFVSRLEELTMQSELQRCTFLPWGGILDPHGCGLLHNNPHWCRECFDEWRRDGIEPYFPLIWMAAPVHICPKHKTLLADTCLHCGRSQPFIPKHAYLDHCSHCGMSLGGGEHYVATTPAEGSEFLRYQVKVVGEMIEHAPGSGVIGRLEDFQRQIRNTADMHFSGSVSAFERAIGFGRKSVRNWFKRQTQPSLPLLMQMSCRLGTTLLGFLKCGVPINGKSVGRNPATARVYKRVKLSKEKLVEIRTTLQKILSAGVVDRPMKQVAEDLDVPYTYLNYWFRDECKNISELYREFRSSESKRKREADIIQAKATVVALYQERVKMTRRVIDLRLREHGINLSRPEIRLAVKEAQSAYLRPGG